jgi:hypothetical protein
MKRFSLPLFILCMAAMLFAVLELQSCHHDPVGTENIRTICFEKEILPIYQGSCGATDCHGGARGASGFSVTSYASIMKAVTAGDPKASKAYTVLISNYFNHMPPTREISVEDRTLIELWIFQGAKDTQCDNNNNITSYSSTAVTSTNAKIQ